MTDFHRIPARPDRLPDMIKSEECHEGHARLVLDINSSADAFAAMFGYKKLLDRIPEEATDYEILLSGEYVEDSTVYPSGDQFEVLFHHVGLSVKVNSLYVALAVAGGVSGEDEHI